MCGRLLIIGIPFRKIARQFAKASEHVRAEKRCTPADYRIVTKQLSHKGDRETIIVNRSSSRTAVSDRDPLVAYSIGDTPVFKISWESVLRLH